MKNSFRLFLAIVLGITGIIASFTFYLAGLSFLSVIGLILALNARKKTKSSLSLIALGVNSIGVVVLVLYVVILNYSEFKEPVYEYYIPKGFTGWIVVQSNNKNAAPIPVQSNGLWKKYHIVVPKDGTLQTSSVLDNEKHSVKYFRYDEKGAVPIPPWEGDLSNNQPLKSFFHCEGSRNEYFYFYTSAKEVNDGDTSIMAACQHGPDIKPVN